MEACRRYIRAERGAAEEQAGPAARGDGCQQRVCGACGGPEVLSRHGGSSFRGHLVREEGKSSQHSALRLQASSSGTRREGLGGPSTEGACCPEVPATKTLGQCQEEQLVLRRAHPAACPLLANPDSSRSRGLKAIQSRATSPHLNVLTVNASTAKRGRRGPCQPHGTSEASASGYLSGNEGGHAA